MHHSEYIDADGLFDVFVAMLFKVFTYHDAGIVEEDVHRPYLGEGEGCSPFDVFQIRYVHQVGVGGITFLFKFLGGGFEIFAVDVPNHQFGSTIFEAALAEHFTDAIGTSGNKHDFIFNLGHKSLGLKYSAYILIKNEVRNNLFDSQVAAWLFMAKGLLRRGLRRPFANFVSVLS